jgi:cholest-4-en-3-one 26-monooxygenase
VFRPRSVAALEEKLAVAARDILTAAAAKDDVATKLPLLAIADLTRLIESRPARKGRRD